jgi:hypothetical protein
MTARQDLVHLPENAGPGDRKRLEATNRGLKILNPTGKELEDYQEEIVKKPRMKYAAMRAHMEMSAQALAVGSTQKLAAQYAGVSARQIKKYMQDSDFRARILELRAITTSKINGKIIRELDRRTGNDTIKNMELLDLLRIMDRLSPTGGKGMAINVEGDVNVGNKYDNILAALFSPDTGKNGVDFPEYGASDVLVPGTSSPLDG